MADWKCQLKDVLAHQRSSFLNDPRGFVADAKLARERLLTVDVQATEQLWRHYNDAVERLTNGIECGAVNPGELKHTQQIFKDLANSSSASSAVLGSQGVILAAVLEDDYYLAALTVYRTTEVHPAAAVQVFSEEYYTGNFREILMRSYKDLKRTRQTCRQVVHANRSKRLKIFPTFVTRALVVAPINYFLALFDAAGPLPEVQQSSGHRQRPFSSRLLFSYNQRMRAFDVKLSNRGWAFSVSDRQKEHMLQDQVKRLSSIYQNHILATTQEAKTKRREIEALTDGKL